MENVLTLGQVWVKGPYMERDALLEKNGVRRYHYVMKKFSNETNIFICPSNFVQDMLYLDKIISILKPKHAEIFFHTHLYRLPFYVLMLKMHNIPIVAWCTGGEILYFDNWWIALRNIVRFVLNSSKLLFLVEPYMEDKIRRYKITKNPNRIYCPNKISVSPERKQSGIEDNPKKILFLNSFKRWRHPELIVKAIPYIIREYQNVLFLFIGARNENEKNYLYDYVRRLRVARYVVIDSFTNDVETYYRDTYLFVLPSDVIYCNHSLLEAMEWGIPPIITNVDKWGAEIATNNYNGIVTGKDPELIAKAILFLLKNPGIRNQYGRNARKTVLEKFNVNDWIKIVCSSYKDKVWKR